MVLALLGKERSKSYWAQILLGLVGCLLEQYCQRHKKKFETSPERFELSRGNPMYLAGTRLNHSAKATLIAGGFCFIYGLILLGPIPKPNISSPIALDTVRKVAMDLDLSI
ncbi:hypothetical protein ACH5RR_003977 [Cinchona calisaya]|uniref:Uncharacterized protein n=1 Tax=Cinchona calisaya TaxID=153742 RepID=A0ABD3AWF3_9GENT